MNAYQASQWRHFTIGKIFTHALVQVSFGVTFLTNFFFFCFLSPALFFNVLYRTFVPISLCWLSELNQYHCEWDKIKTKTSCFRNALRSKQEGFVQQQNHSIFQLESLVCNKFFMFRWDWMFLIQEFSSKIPLAGCRLLKFLW